MTNESLIEIWCDCTVADDCPAGKRRGGPKCSILKRRHVTAQGDVQTLNIDQTCVQKTPENEHIGDASARKDEAQAHCEEASASRDRNPAQLGDACNIGSPSEISVVDKIARIIEDHLHFLDDAATEYSDSATPWEDALRVVASKCVDATREPVSVSEALKSLDSLGFLRGVTPNNFVIAIAEAWGLPYVD